MYSADNILTDLTQHFSTEQATPAWLLDTDASLLQKELQSIGKLGCFRLKAPRQYGGLECSEAEYHRFKQTIIQYSGALTFLQHQHQGAIRLVAASHDDTIKQYYIPQLMSGELLVAIGISQLRQRDHCSLRGIKTKGGYRVTGTIPWASGYKHFKKIIIGFITEENEAVFATTPFRNKNSQQLGQLIISKPLPLIVTQSTNTVNINLVNYFIPTKRIVQYRSGGDFISDDFVLLNNCSFHIGLAQAALNLIQTFVGARYNTLIDVVRAAEQELSTYTAIVVNALTASDFTNSLTLRTRGIRLSNHLTQLACTLYKGQSILQTNPAQRLYRECLLFNSFGASDPLVEHVQKIHAIA